MKVQCAEKLMVWC